MINWKKHAAIILLAMFILTIMGLYGAYQTMERTTLRTDYDFITVRLEEGTLRTSVFGKENSFSITKLEQIKDFLKDTLNISRWEEYMDKSGYFR